MSGSWSPRSDLRLLSFVCDIPIQIGKAVKKFLNFVDGSEGIDVCYALNAYFEEPYEK